MSAQVKKDPQTVTPDGNSISKYIEGVELRLAKTQIDERGELTEIFNPAWGVLPEPLVYVYQSIIRPGKVKGWVVHEHQEDRLFVSAGSVKIVLFDDRPDSATYGMLNEFFLGERKRGVIVIPRGVFHAVQNVGQKEALFINMPTRPFCHENPDKLRLALENDRIPYSFDRGIGW